jgi:hypothetical protein
MGSDIMVWDLETVPDLDGFARSNDLIGKSPTEIRAAMGDDLPKLDLPLDRLHRRTGSFSDS